MVNDFDMQFGDSKNKKVLPAIIVLDSSTAMAGDTMLRVCDSIRNLRYKFDAYNRSDDGEFLVKVALMVVSTEFRWSSCTLREPMNLELPDIPRLGRSDWKYAVEELERILSQSEDAYDPATSGQPFICFISASSDNCCNVSLGRLKDNPRYCLACKAAIAIGDYAACDMLGVLADGADKVIRLNSDVFFDEVLNGLCMPLLTSAARVEATEEPLAAIWSIDGFDSDEACFSTMVRCDDAFDSDEACYSVALQRDDEFDSDAMCQTVPLPQNSGAGCDAGYGGVFDTWEDGGQPAPPLFQDKLPYSADAACLSCGGSVANSFRFCPNCGMPMGDKASSKVNLRQVRFSAITPKRFIKGEYAMIDIAVYEDAYRNVVDRMISNSESETREVIGSAKEISDRTVIRIELSSPDLDLEDYEETQTWTGRYLTFSFPFEIPEHYSKKQILFRATVYFNDLVATRLKIIANCSSARDQKAQLIREDVLSAFVSYASQDRSRVAAIIQGMQKARPDMDIFFDVEYLRSGENWERRIQEEIEKRDILFLCWSKNARDSAWVEKEWRHALSNKGLDSIDPIPLVPPTECPPPEELNSKHFNDRALLYMNL